MSYILEIWEQSANTPYSFSVDDVFDQVMQMHGTHTDQNQKFIIFANLLTSQFPDWHQLLARGIESTKSVWLDSPFDGVCDEAVYNIGVDLCRVDDFFNLLISSAQKLQLSVSDPQTGEVWLGNGIYLFSSDAPQKINISQDGDISYLPYTEILNKEFFKKIEPCMSSYGFYPSNITNQGTSSCINYFEKNIEFVKLFIGTRIHYRDDKKRILFCFDVGGILTMVEKFIANVTGNAKSESQLFQCPSFIISNNVWSNRTHGKYIPLPNTVKMGLNGSFNISNTDDVSFVIEHFERQMKNILSHILYRCQDINWVYEQISMKDRKNVLATIYSSLVRHRGVLPLSFAACYSHSDLVSILLEHKELLVLLQKHSYTSEASRLSMIINVIEDDLKSQTTTIV